MSVDVANSDPAAVVVRRRVYSAQNDSPPDDVSDLPTLLRIPDMLAPRPGSPASDQQVDGKDTASGVRVADPIAASQDDGGGHSPKKSGATVASLLQATGTTFEAARRFTARWKSRLSIVGAVAAAVIACTLLARAMKREPLDALPLQQLTADSVSAQGEDPQNRAGAEVATLERHFEPAEVGGAPSDAVVDVSFPDSVVTVLASDQRGPSGFGPSRSELELGNAPAADGATEVELATEPAAVSSGPEPAIGLAMQTTGANEVGLGGNGDGAYTDLGNRPPNSQTDMSPPADLEVARQSRFAFNGPIPPDVRSTSTPDTPALDQSQPITPVQPSGVWPSSADDASWPTTVSGGTTGALDAVRADPQTKNYPKTDTTRFVPLVSLRTELYEQKRQREQRIHVADQRSHSSTTSTTR